MMPVVDQDILAIENEDSCSIDVDIADNLKNFGTHLFLPKNMIM